MAKVRYKMADYEYEQAAMRAEVQAEIRARRDALTAARKALLEVGWNGLTDDERHVLTD